MKDIYNLFKSVADVKVKNPSAEILAIDHLFNHNERDRFSFFPLVKTTKHTVVVKKKISRQLVTKSLDFYMNNAPSELLKQQLVANPKACDQITLIADETPGELVESNQEHK